MKVEIKCPYCGFKMHREVLEDTYKPKVECCPCDEGGCDRYFAVAVRFTPEVQTFTIEPKAVE